MPNDNQDEQIVTASGTALEPAPKHRLVALLEQELASTAEMMERGGAVMTEGASIVVQEFGALATTTSRLLDHLAAIGGTSPLLDTAAEHAVAVLSLVAEHVVGFKPSAQIPATPLDQDAATLLDKVADAIAIAVPEEAVAAHIVGEVVHAVADAEAAPVKPAA